MTRTIHGGIRAETRDPVVLRGFVKGIPGGRLAQYRTHVMNSDVIGPRIRCIYFIYDILTVLIVKITVSHCFTPYEADFLNHYRSAVKDQEE
jgi:hypothetical protein